jgi:phage shock protein A
MCSPRIEVGYARLSLPGDRDPCGNDFGARCAASLGFFVSTIEDPELILEQNIRDLNDQVPKMNESIAMVRANVTLLEKENAKYKTEVADLTAKVKAAIQAGRDDLAAQYATRLQMDRGAWPATRRSWPDRQGAYDKA